MKIKERINLNEEVRCGYTISTKLKKIWNIEIDLLVKLLEVCEKHDIKVFAYAGTLLGAVRHKGFIPWDDDMDVAMTREDFYKLITYVNEFKFPYFLQYALNDRQYFIDYARLRNSDTTGIITWNKNKKYNNGIFIDIFVLDGMPQNKLQIKKFIFKRNVYRQFIYSYYISFARENWGMKRRIVLELLHPISKLRSYEEWIKVYNNLLHEYAKSSLNITLMTHDSDVMHKYWCNKDDIKNISWVDFETIKIPILANYDAILTHFYGDYIKFPPVEQRGAWHENMIIYDPDQSYIDYMSHN